MCSIISLLIMLRFICLKHIISMTSDWSGSWAVRGRLNQCFECFTVLSLSDCSRVNPPVLDGGIWQYWHSGWESSSLGQGKVIYFRWPARSSGLKLSLSFHSLSLQPLPCPSPLALSPFLFPRWVPTQFLQLQHTVRMMGLRFCSVKRVETSSLVLTPLSCPFGEGFQELEVPKLVSFSCSTAV